MYGVGGGVLGRPNLGVDITFEWLNGFYSNKKHFKQRHIVYMS